MGKRGPKPRQLIDTTWTPELAYVVGLIATDGCLSIDGRHIDLTSTDLEQIKTFQTLLFLHHIKIGTKTSGYSKGKTIYRIQFGNVFFYRWLVSIGLTASKSKTMGSLDVPDQYFFDFLRGCLDGDGCVYSYWDPRWRSSYMYYFEVTSASPVFLAWLQNSIQRLIGFEGKIGALGNSRAQNLRFAKTASKELFSRMYYAHNIPELIRKFAKVQEIIRIDDTHNAQVVKLVNTLV